VVNDVQIISASDQSEKKATVNDVFTMPDILRTGPASRAELVAQDETVTRVGANTIFSFDPASRTIDLKQGSLLFHSPHGKGGGTIHTGSATASVLGTTLIVTTTPSGGMKVLDLEGNVEVKFLSGLHQNLNPGQMTFVLPGGNQLAPIIVYRLDDLTKNSLLVKGFNQQLSSMPLIEQQINKQLNLIKNGHYTDTGLLVGDDASSSQVQVLDLNTLQSALDNSGLNGKGIRRAFATDATINQPSLTDKSVPTPPTHVFLQQFTMPKNTFFTGQPFEGFAARNIFFNTAGSEASTLSVDLSPYANLSEFDMVAAKNINIEGSVNFTGFSPENSIFFLLAAGNQIVISPGVTLTANAANLELESAGAFTLNSASIVNNAGNTAMLFGSDVTLENGASINNTLGDLFIQTTGNFNVSDSTLDANTMELKAPLGALTVNSSTLIYNTFGFLQSANDVNVSSSVISANPETGLTTITSTGGSVNLTSDSIQTFALTINSGDGILLSGSGQSYGSSGGAANFTAPNLIQVNDADLSGFANVNMVAHTINLFNVAFAGGSVDNFGTHTGNATIDGNTPGDLNLHNVTYGGTAITSLSQINFTTGPSTTPGINSYANGH
jgi:hypothetical protein